MNGQSKPARETREPPNNPSSDALKFDIATDASSNWIVMEAHGQCSGVPVDGDAANHFSDFECRNSEATFKITKGRTEQLVRKNGKLYCGQWNDRNLGASVGRSESRSTEPTVSPIGRTPTGSRLRPVSSLQRRADYFLYAAGVAFNDNQNGRQ